jgi:hypothetical protein
MTYSCSDDGSNLRSFPYGTTQPARRRIPGPECQIYISDPSKDNSSKILLNAIIDTGASRTLIPKIYIDLLRIADIKGEEIKVRSSGSKGRPEQLSTHWIDIILIGNQDCRHQIDPIPVGAKPDLKYALIGRDILNKMKIVLLGSQDRAASLGEWRINCSNCGISRE